jgi:hypothetical protein
VGSVYCRLHLPTYVTVRFCIRAYVSDVYDGLQQLVKGPGFYTAAAHVPDNSKAAPTFGECKLLDNE